MRQWLQYKIPSNVIIPLGIAFIFLLWFYPSQLPPPWFDEGWTLATARNWVENGQYARLLNNEPISATGMAWNFPVTAPIALSFRIFGFGIWQGRLPNSIFTIFSIFLIYLLAKQMYNEKIGIASLYLLLLGFPFPLLYGRQGIGEPAMIFYLLAGYYIFWNFIEKHSILSIGISMLMWGLALTSKHQAAPFWALSMFSVILFAGIKQETFIFRTSVYVTLGTLLIWQGMLQFQHLLETNLPLYGSPMKGLIFVTGWVPILELRIKAFVLAIAYDFPLILGLGYAFFVEHTKKMQAQNNLFYLRLTYWSLTSSWFLWFITLAMPWVRYLYPIAFLGSIYVATLILRLKNNLRFSQIVNLVSTTLRKIRIKSDGLLAISCIILISCIGVITLKNFLGFISINNDAEQIAQYLNQSIPTDSLIETYDSELLFLVQRRFHYPPDQVQVELNKRVFLNQTVEVQYDPMFANPDYIVIGPYGAMWKLYDSNAAQNDIWELVYETSYYRVYKQITQK